MRVAVLDLGTNTFNLIVAEKNESFPFLILHNSKLPVKLGEKGINKGEITQEAFNRGIEAVKTHFDTITKLHALKVMAFGTSALRTTKNGNHFIRTIKDITGIEVEIITGDREAELIYYGVRQTHSMDSGKYLILDIGGGSNELIIADNDSIYWKRSYELGIARLLELFKPSDPITDQEIEKIKKYLLKELPELKENIELYQVKALLGASGSFETFVSMIHADSINDETQSSLFPRSVTITQEEFNALYEKLIRSTIAERSTMKGLEPMRIEMIVLACVFVKFIIENLKLKEIYQSNFALKEGAIYQLFIDNQ
jgi:exopolyphosphatase/guanosine-5'-triphosphate,3'-diphosphate pyrophosphatase